MNSLPDNKSLVSNIEMKDTIISPVIPNQQNMNTLSDNKSLVSNIEMKDTIISPVIPNQQVKESNEDDYLDINSLPNEIILKIFGYLTQNELGRITRVCSRWCALVKSPLLWKNVSVRLNNDFPTAAAKSIINILPPCVSCIRLDFGFCYWWTQDLDFKEFSLRLKDRCPYLKTLILDKAKLSDSLPSLIDLCTQFLPNVTRLMFHHCRFPYCPVRENTGASSTIEVLDLSGSYLGFTNRLSFSKMKHLEELCLTNSVASDSWFEGDAFSFNKLHVLHLGDTNIGSVTFDALKSHGLKLKELYLCHMNVKDDDLSFPDSVFPHLKTICLRGTDVTCEGVVTLIKSCPSLQNVYVRQDVAQSYAKHPFVDVNKHKLGIVKVIKCLDHGRKDLNDNI